MSTIQLATETSDLEIDAIHVLVNGFAFRRRWQELNARMRAVDKPDYPRELRLIWLKATEIHAKKLGYRENFLANTQFLETTNPPI